MAGVVALFERAGQTISAKLSQGERPTPQIIAGILRDQCNKAQGMLLKERNGEVRVACVEAFASVGWDFLQNKSAAPAPPSIEQVLGMLSSAAARIQALTSDAHAAPRPSAQELADLTLATDRLWDLDADRLHPETGDYQLNLQEGKRFGDHHDAAREPLFAFVNEELLRKPVFASFIALLDNYSASTGVAETVTREEAQENQRFLEHCMATPVMRYCHAYLVAKGKAPADAAAFKTQLSEIWFQLYERTRGIRDSSGFEHVFVGEVKQGKCIGFHNWIRLYMEEKAGRFDYKGYIKPRVRGGRPRDPMDTEQLVSINFDWQGVEKDTSTVLIGVSPAFELALYTMCFLCSPEEKQVVKLGPYMAEITCHRYTSRGKTFVGSSYPGAAPLGEDAAASRIQAQFRGMQTRRLS